MKYFKNPYYSSDDRDFVSTTDKTVVGERMRRIKVNTKFLLSVFQIMKDKEDFMNTPSMKKYWEKVIIAGNLANSDKVTGFNTKKLGEKVKFLVKALADKNHPENLEVYKNSFFVKSILEPLFHGDFSFSTTAQEIDDRWELYKKVGNDPELDENKIMNSAMKCYIDDEKAPVGLDLSTLIDCIVKEDKFGNYQLVGDFDDLDMKENAIEAVKEFIELLKTNPRFKSNFTNPNVIESEMIEE